MNAAQSRRAEELHEQLRGARPEEWSALLEAACPDDPDVRACVQRRLTQAQAATQTGHAPIGDSGNADCASGAQEAPGADPLDRIHDGLAGHVRQASRRVTDAIDVRKGSQIGPYKLLEKVGEGAFGEVWRAQRPEPRMTVAIKIIRRDRIDKASRARFAKEAQALAELDHPNITKIHDAGVTDDGLPYIVMEYVQGIPLNEYCDRERLTIRERLALMATVCDAVNHAHLTGIMHRDLSPDNILVTVHENETPQPKIVDFGIAKAVNPNVRLSQDTVTEDLNTLIGKPAYMSPEQAEASQAGVDARTDIFALGAILYELLTGILPISKKDLQQAGIVAIIEMLRGERCAPAAKFETLGTEDARAAASSRGFADLEGLGRVLRGRLQHLPMKALRVDRMKRFSSAATMATDIRRYLRHEDYVEAAAEPAWDKVVRSVKRNKWTYAVSAPALLLVVALVVGLVRSAALNKQRGEDLIQLTGYQAAQLAGIDARSMGQDLRQSIADRRRDALRSEGLAPYQVEAKLDELEDSLDGVNFTSIALDTVDEHIFERAIAAIEKQFADQPVVSLDLLNTVANARSRLGLLGRAEEPLAQAIDISEDLFGEGSYATDKLIAGEARVLWQQGKLKEAEEKLRPVLVRQRKELGDEHYETLDSMNTLALVLIDLGKYAEAEECLDMLVRSSRKAYGEHALTALQAIGNMGLLRSRQGMLEEAERYYREALDGFRVARGEEDGETLRWLNNLASVLVRLGRFEEAATCFAEALEGRRRALGDDHPDTLLSLNNIGAVLLEQGKLVEAEGYLREVLERRRRLLGDDHPDTLGSLTDLCWLLVRQGNVVEAAEYCDGAVAECNRALGAEHPLTLTATCNAALLLDQQGKVSEAEGQLRDALERLRRTVGDDHPNTLMCMNNLGSLLLRQDRLTEAEPYCREAVERRRRVLGPKHPRTLGSTETLAALLALKGELAEAEPLCREALEGYRSVLGEDHSYTLAATREMAELLRKQGKLSSAEAYYRDALRGWRAVRGPDHSVTLQSLQDLARVLSDEGKLAEAERYQRELLRGCCRALGNDDPHTLTALVSTAALVRRMGRYTEAERLGAEALRRVSDAFPSRYGGRALFLHEHAKTLAAMSRFTEAEAEMLEAHASATAGLGDDAELAEHIIESLIWLYETRHRVEPSQGHNEQAEVWRRELEARHRTTQEAGESAPAPARQED